MKTIVYFGKFFRMIWRVVTGKLKLHIKPQAPKPPEESAKPFTSEEIIELERCFASAGWYDEPTFPQARLRGVIPMLPLKNRRGERPKKIWIRKKHYIQLTRTIKGGVNE